MPELQSVTAELETAEQIRSDLKLLKDILEFTEARRSGEPPKDNLNFLRSGIRVLGATIATMGFTAASRGCGPGCMGGHIFRIDRCGDTYIGKIHRL